MSRLSSGQYTLRQHPLSTILFCVFASHSVDLLVESPENLFTMRAVVQRVSRAEVVVGGESVGRIEKGILALVAISRQDSEKDLHWMAKKIVELRIFDDDEGKLNLSLQDIRGQLLVVSQFTLYGDCKKGRRPSYTEAASPADAEKLYRDFVEIIRRHVPDVQTGQFQAMMEVTLTNAGPVTLILNSRD
jgi:D-tyrosyl-tRNA(Tyr) deacylase